MYELQRITRICKIKITYFFIYLRATPGTSPRSLFISMLYGSFICRLRGLCDN